jgi:hypothetical protein
MDEGELLEILTNISEDLEALRRETRSRLNAELSVLRRAVNAMLPHIPPAARARLAAEYREVIAQEAQSPEPTLPRTMAILAMPNAMLPLYPRYAAENQEGAEEQDARWSGNGAEEAEDIEN